MDRDFRITIGSESDCEELVGDIYYKNKFVATINQERGFDNLEIELPSKENCGDEHLFLSLNELLEAIEYVKERLYEIRYNGKSAFPQAEGTIEEINIEGQRLLDEIIYHPEAVVESNKFNGKDIRIPDGRGVRYGAEEDFHGFLEP